MAKKRIVVLGSRELAVQLTFWMLEQPNVEVIGCVIPDYKGGEKDPFYLWVRSRGLPEYPVDALAELRPDLAFSLNYWRAIPEHLIDAVPGGIVNIHHSYRLRYKGRNTCSWAIMKAREDDVWYHGTTLHYIDKELDKGRIIATEKCPITEEDTAFTLFGKVEQLAADLFRRKFADILAGQDGAAEQEDETSYFFDAKQRPDIPEETAAALYDYARAWSFPGKPAPVIEFNGHKIRLQIDSE